MVVANSWEGVSLHAKRVGAKFPELVAAQWALESGFGKHLSSRHNYFGLKGSGSSRETKEFYDGQWVTIKAGFINFPSLAACIEYLVTRWHKDYKQFRGVNNAPDRYTAARMLKDQGYATDPTYPAKLNKLMKQHSPSSSIRLASAAKFYKEESHQLAAWNWLQEQLTETELEEFAELYRAAPASKPSNPLMVPYFSQRDNASGQGNRECFSSSCAMVAAYYGKVKGDDEYNVIRARFGDTTNADAQVKALQSLGLKASFITDGTEALLQNEIKEGRPVAVGWLHYGPSSAPIGGGHWSVVVGFNSQAYIHNDPFGKANIINGGYLSASGGNNVSYGKTNWLPRWRVNGTGGWAILVRK
jgi:hypothetical protein